MVLNYSKVKVFCTTGSSLSWNMSEHVSRWGAHLLGQDIFIIWIFLQKLYELHETL